MPFAARSHQLKHSLLYHIFNRGNGKKEIFHEAEDYHRFIRLLSDYANKHEFVIYHWVLMPNHYHFILEIADPERISSIMAGIARAYVHYHHKKYQSAGYLWQGRFKSQPIQKEMYLLTCGRYVERNPVKAGLVQNAWDYAYSSACYYATGNNDGLTTEDPLFSASGSHTEECRRKYQDYLLTFENEDEWLFENLEAPRGSEEFLKRLVREKGLLLPRRRGKVPK
ncbi:MAG: transposase [Candidatus Omnitrophica bacterium]|nr:transposase [Candidatus Omnitrophota bacterium]